MRTLKDINFKDIRGKKVLLRCDFDVPLDAKGNILDFFRIKQALPTIKYLFKNKAKVILMAHLGRPGGKTEKRLKLTFVQRKLEEYLNFSLKKSRDCIGKEVEKDISELKDGEVLLLENLRFHKEEEANDVKFAKELADLGDFYVNDAFATSHRKHASITGIPQYLSSAAGLLFEKEVKVFSQVLENPQRPLIAIIGGAKISSKAGVIKEFLKRADYLLIGGKVAVFILEAKGAFIGKPLLKKEELKEIKNFNLNSKKLYLPLDAVVSPNKSGKIYSRESTIEKTKKEELILDIGPKTISIFKKIIKKARTVIWSGPLGFFEEPLFEKGTKKIAEEIAQNREAYKIAGGGDTLFALSKFGLRKKFNHISTGGGAMLRFLGGEKLPGLEALKR